MDAIKTKFRRSHECRDFEARRSRGSRHSRPRDGGLWWLIVEVDLCFHRCGRPLVAERRERCTQRPGSSAAEDVRGGRRSTAETCPLKEALDQPPGHRRPRRQAGYGCRADDPVAYVPAERASARASNDRSNAPGSCGQAEPPKTHAGRTQAGGGPAAAGRTNLARPNVLPTGLSRDGDSSGQWRRRRSRQQWWPQRRRRRPLAPENDARISGLRSCPSCLGRRGQCRRRRTFPRG